MGTEAIAALQRMAAPTVKALRDAAWSEVSARELVLGDIIKLETGSVVSADGRVVESVNLRVQEAALTGESEPVEKVTEAFAAADLMIGDRRNMAYLGTSSRSAAPRPWSSARGWRRSWARSRP